MHAPGYVCCWCRALDAAHVLNSVDCVSVLNPLNRSAAKIVTARMGVMIAVLTVLKVVQKIDSHSLGVITPDCHAADICESERGEGEGSVNKGKVCCCWLLGTRTRETTYWVARQQFGWGEVT